MKIGQGKNTKAHPLRKSGKKAAAKERRRVEAKRRKFEYDSLTPEQKNQQREFFKQRYLEHTK